MGSHMFRIEVEKHTKELIKDLEDTKKINDLKQQLSKVSFDVGKHKQKFEELKRDKPEEISSAENYYPYNLEKYEKKIKELDDYWGEIAEKSNKIKAQEKNEKRKRENELKISHCAYCKNKPPAEHYIYSKKNKILKLRKRDASLLNEWLFCSETHFEKWHKKNYYCCAECIEEKYDGKYKYSKSKKDGQKFCSDNCFYIHYAEKCDECLEKCVSNYQGKTTGFAETYYRNIEDKTGTLCSKCHQEHLKELSEEKRKDKEWEEACKRLDKSRDELVDAMVDAVGRDKEEDSEHEEEENDDKSNQIKSNQIKSNQIKSNQIKSNLQTFYSNSISTVELTSEGDLDIKYDKGGQQTVKNGTLTPELQKIKTQMQKNGTKEISKTDLEKQLQELELERSQLEKQREKLEKGQEPKGSGLGWKIGVGVLVGVSLVGLVVALIRKNNKRKKY